MMGRMLAQPVLALLPGGAEEIAPGVGIVAGEDGGGMVTLHGLATVQLVRLRAASQAQVARAFGVDPATVWRWDQALSGGGVAALVPARRGPKGASKLTPEVAARIAGLHAGGSTLRQIATATGVSTFSVRSALGRVAARPSGPAGAEDDVPGHPGAAAGTGAAAPGPGEPLPVLPGPVTRDSERAMSRWGLLGEGAQPVFAPGARYPLAGLLLALTGWTSIGWPGFRFAVAEQFAYGAVGHGYACGSGGLLQRAAASWSASNA